MSWGLFDPPRHYGSAADVVAAYAEGEREFLKVDLRGADFTRNRLAGAHFFQARLPGAVFDGADLSTASFTRCDLGRASFNETVLSRADIRETSLKGARLQFAVFSNAALHQTDLSRANLRHAVLMNARLDGVRLDATRAKSVKLGGTLLSDVDVTALCDADDVRHSAPSHLDPRTVMRTHHHPGLKRFMVDCGVPEIFAEYQIDCARALDDPLLRSLMRSTFISYGGPDEAFARRLYDALRRHGVVAFFFPEDARWGERIDNEVFTRLQEHDRVILVCSRASLDRPGVLNEVQETFDREARDGGATYLLPIMLDDYVLTEWKATQPALAERVRRRVVGDFRDATSDGRAFDAAVSKLLAALKKR